MKSIAKYVADKTFAIVDTETTGTSATGDRVIEVGILRIEGGKCVEEFQTLVNPGSMISPWIASFTGIGQEELDRAPRFEDVADEVLRLLDGAVFVAHNARFDYGFLKNEFKRVGLRFNTKCLCTVRLSRKLYPRSKRHDLSSIIDRYGFQCGARHRAFDDARVLWDFLRLSHEEHGEKLAHAIDDLLQSNTLPAQLPAKDLEHLPESPGVYIFYGAEGDTLYVGKSKNIRTRVMSHFSSDHTSTKEMIMTRQVARVEVRETAGELSALLLESSLVKSMRPMYNRQLLRKRELVVALRKSAGKYSTVELKRVERIEPETFSDVFGIFRNIAQAKEFVSAAATEHQLCKKVLGLEKGAQCFGYQLGTCLGACGEQEDAESYDARLEHAFRARRLRAWPYSGAIMIEERRDDLQSHAFVLDNWCLVGDVRSDADEFEFRARQPEFDHDSYKIFRRYLRDPSHKKNIRPLPRKELQQFLAHDSAEVVIR